MNCEICGENRKTYKNGTLAKTCGNRNCIKILTYQTMKIKYGEKFENIVNRRNVTIKEKYGVDNISQLPEIKERKRITCENNHGVSWPMQSNDIREKSKNTLMEKYGVTNIFQAEHIKAHIKKSVFSYDEELGMTPYEYGMLKIKKQNMKKYGVEFYFQTSRFKRQYKKIMTERYGVDNFFKSDEFKKLMIESGRIYSNEDLEKRNSYYREVMKYTRLSYKVFKDIIELYDKRSVYTHLDHIFSIRAGFDNRIPPKIIGSLINLQLLPTQVNQSKAADCWISEQELHERYESFIRENKFYEGL